MTRVTITEVGPRDGLQNLPGTIDSRQRAKLVERLAATGLPCIEAGSFVSARAVPAMQGSDDVFLTISRQKGTCYMALVPNLQGAERALECRADRLAVFTAASQTFCQKNIGCSIAESLGRFDLVFETAAAANVPVRAYISCVSGCPYEGEVALTGVSRLAATLLEMGADEICLADTTGVGNPQHTRRLIQQVAEQVPIGQIALHMHDTFGTGLLNSWAGFLEGVRSFDASIAGLGGCPYAPGASGNLASEDLVHLMHSMGIETGIDLDALCLLAQEICQDWGLENQSRAGRAHVSRRISDATG